VIGALSLVVMLALMGVFLWAMSVTAGEMQAFEAEGEIGPGAERFPVIAAVALVGYLWIGHLLFS
jgi:hypothetical protein